MKPARPTAKHADSTLSPPSRSLSQTPAPNTIQRATPRVLRIIAASAGERCSAMKAAISAVLAWLPGKSTIAAPSKAPITTLPRLADANPSAPAIPASFMGGMFPRYRQVVDYLGVMEWRPGGG